MPKKAPAEERLLLGAEQLSRRCHAEGFPFADTSQLNPLDVTAGQPRALAALEFGLDCRSAGFNVYVSGPSGTGRQSTVLSLLRARARTEPVPQDRIYVHNFKNTDEPRYLDLPSGSARQASLQLNQVLQRIRQELPALFEGQAFETRRQDLLGHFEAERNRVLEGIQAEAERRHFRVQFAEGAVVTVPLVDGEPLRRDQFSKLEEDRKRELAEESENLQATILGAVNELRRLESETRQAVQGLEKEVAREFLDGVLRPMREDCASVPALLEHLGDLEEDLLGRLDEFRHERDEHALLALSLHGRPSSPVDRYRLNVFVTHEDGEGAPVVYETNPTYYNLFGGIEYRPHNGNLVTDFAMIRAGAVHRANGGYLLLQVRDVLSNPFSWDALKRMIRNSEARVENLGEQFRLIPVATLKPQAPPVNVKIVLIGSPLLHHLLLGLDEDFRKFFKIKADFDDEMPRNPETELLYARFLAGRAREDDLLPFEAGAVASVVEHGARLAQHQDRLSTQFMEIADVAREASYWAARSSRPRVSAADIQHTLDQRRFRSNLLEDKVQELIDEAVVRIEVTGEAVGQINGLSVLDLGDYEFGRPSRISARVSLGKEGVVDIERECETSGKLHSKGVLILSGFLSGRYADRAPLSVSISLGFEQTYEEIDGDSASSTEVYAILSALSGVPLRQSVAVTGSVDQFGNVQAIGGVNEKVEGFFEVCRSRGLNRRQGVLIPRTNLSHLMLRHEVQEAVAKGRFHIWAISHVDEGIEILTGLAAGKRRSDGRYPRTTVNGQVQRRLEQMAEDLREFADGGGGR